MIQGGLALSLRLGKAPDDQPLLRIARLRVPRILHSLTNNIHPSHLIPSSDTETIAIEERVRTKGGRGQCPIQGFTPALRST
jgi:hypothetical protein